MNRINIVASLSEKHILNRESILEKHTQTVYIITSEGYL